MALLPVLARSRPAANPSPGRDTYNLVATDEPATRPRGEAEREAGKLLLLGTAEGVPVPILLYAMAGRWRS